jgi:hyperosmotically inducible periplasmic protein
LPTSRIRLATGRSPAVLLLLRQRDQKRRAPEMFNAGSRNLALALTLVVALAGCATLTGRTAGRNIDDAAITAAVKTKLASDKAATLTAVDVDTVNGTVYLNGTVPDAAARQRAAALARQVDGVVAVENNLQTKSTTAGDQPVNMNRDRHRGDTY